MRKTFIVSVAATLAIVFSFTASATTNPANCVWSQVGGAGYPGYVLNYFFPVGPCPADQKLVEQFTPFPGGPTTTKITYLKNGREI